MEVTVQTVRQNLIEVVSKLETNFKTQLNQECFSPHDSYKKCSQFEVFCQDSSIQGNQIVNLGKRGAIIENSLT